MNLKWVFWTGLLAILVFFSVIYFGIKHDWVGGSRPNTSDSSHAASQPSLSSESNKQTSSANPSAEAQGNGVKPELIDEAAMTVEKKVLGSNDLTIEEVVSRCQNLTESIGIPDNKLEQAISECIERNSRHLASEDNQSSDEREVLVREQCNVAITQKDLLSEDEIKMLIDECVASMSITN